jgi:hypothetical protein
VTPLTLVTPLPLVMSHSVLVMSRIRAGDVANRW